MITWTPWLVYKTTCRIWIESKKIVCFVSRVAHHYGSARQPTNASSVYTCSSKLHLFRFLVDLLYNKLYDTSARNRNSSGVWVILRAHQVFISRNSCTFIVSCRPNVAQHAPLGPYYGKWASAAVGIWYKQQTDCISLRAPLWRLLQEKMRIKNTHKVLRILSAKPSMFLSGSPSPNTSSYP